MHNNSPYWLILNSQTIYELQLNLKKSGETSAFNQREPRHNSPEVTSSLFKPQKVQSKYPQN